MKENLESEKYIGVVEDNNDPKRKGRLKVRVDYLHGRKGDKKFIPTESLPWCSSFNIDTRFWIPQIGKIVYISFMDNDYFKPMWESCEHFNINLQEKLDSLKPENYKEFNAINFDESYQHYKDLDEGLVVDYMKSKINITTKGNIQLGLRDNDSKVFIGSPDANQQALLGNHFINWMDKFVQVLLTNAYIGNLGAPAIANPQLIQIINEFKAIKETFLSDHVYLVDDNMVKPNNRKFDNKQNNDNFNDENMEKVNAIKKEMYNPKSRGKVGNVPETVSPKVFSENLVSTIPYENMTPEDSLKFKSPLGDKYSNGDIPLSGMTVSKYLKESFSDNDDERKYLLNEPAVNLDKWLDEYHKNKETDWYDIIATKGYHDLERQNNIHKTYKASSAKPCEDPFGYGNQVELFLNIEKNSVVSDKIKEYLKSNTINNDSIKEVKMLDYLLKIGEKYRWKLAGKTNNGDFQWWHYIFI